MTLNSGSYCTINFSSVLQMAPCALVHQLSFDIEQFCHEVAEVLCERAGMKFWYCNNYDVEIVDVSSEMCLVIGVW